MAQESEVQTVPMKTEQGIQLMQHWTEQAVGSLIAAVANKNLKTKPKHILLEFGDCTKNAKNIPQQAQCVSKLLRNQLSGKKYLRVNSKRRLHKYSQQKRTSKSFNKTGSVGSFRLYNMANSKVRRKRAATKRQKYELLSTHLGQMTPLGGVAQLLMKSVLAAKNKTKTIPWQETISKLQKSALKKEALQLSMQPKTTREFESMLVKNLRKHESMNLKSFDEFTAKMPVLPTEKPRKMPDQRPRKIVNLLRDGFKLAWSLSGKNASEFSNKTVKAFSPRFFSILPEEENEKGDLVEILSPSLLSLHKEGKGIEKLTSLPSLINGFNNHDQQSWMNLIMEASGVTEQADKIDMLLNQTAESSLETFQKRYQDEARATDGTPLYFTKENVTKMYGRVEESKITVFERLNSNLSTDQIHELNKTGYALLTSFQLMMLYGPQSPYADSKSLEHFIALNHSYLEQTIENDIHRTAQLKSFKMRLRRQTPSSVLGSISFVNIAPNSGGAIVLSPVIFSPVVLAPAVLGPVILSPLLFVPVIVSPRALSPLILSPLAFVPFILSPVVLHPVILSPGVFVPIILTPLALTPFIMSPQVFTPNPAAASPIILSPYVLSPIILSPQAFSALILSPYVLSPVILSPLIAYTVLLSPSYLS